MKGSIHYNCARFKTIVKKDVYTSILSTAESFIQLNGYNAFSYRDIASVVGVKTSSIHYHFPTKEDLGKAVVVCHQEKLSMQLQSIAADSGSSCSHKIAQFFDGVLNATYYSEQKMCFFWGGHACIRYFNVTPGNSGENPFFFNIIEGWLAEIIQAGVYKGEFKTSLQSRQSAMLAVSMLEGALLPNYCLWKWLDFLYLNGSIQNYMLWSKGR